MKTVIRVFEEQNTLQWIWGKQK